MTNHSSEMNCRNSGRMEAEMKRVYISGAIRTPLGTYQGALADFSEQKLAAMTMLDLIENVDIDPIKIDEIIIGNSKQTSTPSNLARHAQLEAEFPVEIPAYTVQRQSASGLQAVINGYLAIRSENADVILAGGSESMSQVPLEIRKARFAFGADTEIVFDPIASQLAGAQPSDRYGKLKALDIADAISAQYGITESEIETYLDDSLKKCMLSKAKVHILPLEVKKKKTVELINADQQYQEIPSVAMPADGAAMCLLCSENAAKEQGLPVRGEILGIAFAAGSPKGSGYIADEVITRAVEKAGLSLSEIDYFEISEFSAAQILANRKVLKSLGIGTREIDRKVNSEGGTLVSGLSWGAAGAVLLTDLLYKLQGEGKKYGMVIAPAEGGQTLSMVIEAKYK